MQGSSGVLDCTAHSSSETQMSILPTNFLYKNRFGGNGVNHTNKLSPKLSIDVSKPFCANSSYVLSSCVCSGQIPITVKCTKRITEYYKTNKSIEIIVLVSKASHGNPKCKAR